LAGLINDQNVKSANRVPFLGELPIIGHLFSDNTTNKSKTEIILSITPHIIRNQHQPDAGLSSYWSGTGNNVRSRPITLEKVDSLKVDSSGGNSLINSAAPNAMPLPEIAPAPLTAPDSVPASAAAIDVPSGDVGQSQAMPVLNSTPPVVFRPAVPVNPSGQIPLNPNSPVPAGGTGMGGAVVNKPKN
jgi:general secretion pathway protein D